MDLSSSMAPLIIEDAEGVPHIVPVNVWEATAVTDADLASKIAPVYKFKPSPAYDPTKGEVSAYGMGLTTSAYDPKLAELYNLWANIQLSLGAKKGSDLYKETYDIDGNGIINGDDAAIVKKKIYEYGGGGKL